MCGTLSTIPGYIVLMLMHCLNSWPAGGSSQNGAISSVISGMVTLGTPHLPPQPPVMDMTRGALTFVDQEYPGAFLQKDGVFYCTVAGQAIRCVRCL